MAAPATFAPISRILKKWVGLVFSLLRWKGRGGMRTWVALHPRSRSWEPVRRRSLGITTASCVVPLVQMQSGWLPALPTKLSSCGAQRTSSQNVTCRDNTLLMSQLSVSPLHQIDSYHVSLSANYALGLLFFCLLIAGRDGRVVLWDPVSGSILQKAVRHMGGILHCGFSLKDNAVFATASEDKTVGIWEIKAPNNVMVMKELNGHKDIVFQTCFSSDNITLASCSNDKSIRLWNRRTGKHLSKLKDPYSRILTCQFSPDGTMIAAVVEGERVRIWNTIQGDIVNVLEGHHIERITCCAFSPDGSTIATGAGDKTFALWSTDKHRALPEFHTKAHQDWIQTVAFSPNGKILATGSNDNTVSIWVAQL